MKRKKAFTLIELLVVVGIIALLVAILFPSFKKARGQARRTTCASQLHQVCLGMMSYMQDSHDHMPWISYMPSISPAPIAPPCRITTPPDCDTIYFAEVLRPHLGKSQSRSSIPVLQCPDDRPGSVEDRPERPSPNTGLSYFQSERSSYEYRWRLQGLTPQDFSSQAGGANPYGRRFWQRNNAAQPHIAPATIWFTRDYDNFHGKEGTNGSRRYGYIDGHVEDYVN